MLDRLLRRSPALKRDYFHLGTASEYNLRDTLQRKGIKTVVPLGERAMRQILGESGIERWRGRIVDMPGLPDIKVIPTFAPSKLLPHRSDDTSEDKMRHPPRFHGVWMWDVAKAMDVAANGVIRLDEVYLCDPTPEEFTAWILGYFAALDADPFTWLSWDIETPYKMKAGDEGEFEESESTFEDHIIRISFSYREGHAVSVPWSGRYLDGIRMLLATRGNSVVWNGATFDVPKVLANNFAVNGTVFDFMDGWHVFQSDLDKGLEFVTSLCTTLLPWKHLSVAEPARYSCIDADAALRNANAITRWLKANGMWEAFMRHSVKLMPILYEAGQRGNLINVVAQEALKVELDALKVELTAKAQPMVPRSVRNRELKKTLPDVLAHLTVAPSYAPQPQLDVVGVDATEWEVIFEAEQVKVCSACRAFASNKSEHFKGSKEPHPEKPGKLRQVKNPCKVAGGEIILAPAYVPRFYEVLPFNCNSSDQIKAYIRHFDHPMGRDKKDSSKESADAKHLKDLKKQYGHKHGIYDVTLNYHQVSKTRGTYCPTPDAHNRIHTTYKNNTSTWRLASANLNMQNWGKREGNPYAKKARKQIIASPGCKLVQIDSASVEAVMLGYFMGNRDYMAKASSGIHAWLTAMELGMEFTPANVDIIKTKFKKEYDAFKIANHMSNYGGGPAVLFASAPDVFGSKAGAERVQQRIFELLPALAAFQHEVRIRAQKESYLKNPWGHRHYFYDVFTTARDGTVKWGKDSKRCVAYLPQSSNGCFQRDNIVLVADEHTSDGHCLREWMPANLSVHDSMCLDTPDAYVEEVIDILVRVFTRRIPEMEGLRIGAEVEVGLNWGDMDSVRKIAIAEKDLLDATPLQAAA